VATNKAGGNNKRRGRNEAWCKAYRARNQRERNKLVRLRKHIAKFPADDNAKRVARECALMTGAYFT